MDKQYTPQGDTCRVTFSLPHQAVLDGEDVRLVGDFNAWDWHAGYRLRRTPDDYRADVELPVGRDYEFRFLIDNRQWENHWSADGYVPSPFGVDNSVVSLPRRSSTLGAVHLLPIPDDTVHLSEDDLTEIEGIGPKISALLKNAGIASFAQLAHADPARLTTILDAAGSSFSMHDPATWPTQASLAAIGDWARLRAMQERLAGGREA